MNAESLELLLVQQSQSKDCFYDNSGFARESFCTPFTTNGYYLNMYLTGKSSGCLVPVYHHEELIAK